MDNQKPKSATQRLFRRQIPIQKGIERVAETSEVSNNKTPTGF
jgi:hypothetical protein